VVNYPWWGGNTVVDVMIIDGARTPFGAYGGGLRDTSATDLAICATQGALHRSGVDSNAVDTVVFGNVVQTSPDAVYLARHVALRVGLEVTTPAHTVNRLCGSGLQAVIDGALAIGAGYSQLAVVGGAENMSAAPHVVYGARWGLGPGSANLEDALWAALTDRYCGLGISQTAENLVEQFAITRNAQDTFALRSHQRAAAARAAGRLAAEIVPVPAHDRQGNPVQIEQDEQIRSDMTLGLLGSLPARVGERGSVTAGNAGGIADGAAALILASAEYVAHARLQALGRVVSWAAVGVNPAVMGIGPLPATQRALDRAELQLADIDRFEINEAFAAQYLVVERELGLDPGRVNMNGGAIALGHPLGASGARLLLTLLYELRRTKLRYGLVALSIAGGQGLAMIVENQQR